MNCSHVALTRNSEAKVRTIHHTHKLRRTGPSCQLMLSPHVRCARFHALMRCSPGLSQALTVAFLFVHSDFIQRRALDFPAGWPLRVRDRLLPYLQVWSHKWLCLPCKAATLLTYMLTTRSLLSTLQRAATPRLLQRLQSILFWTSITTLQPHRIVVVTIATLQRLDTAVAIACMRSVSRAIYHGTLLSVVAQAFWYG